MTSTGAPSSAARTAVSKRLEVGLGVRREIDVDGDAPIEPARSLRPTAAPPAPAARVLPSRSAPADCRQALRHASSTALSGGKTRISDWPYWTSLAGLKSTTPSARTSSVIRGCASFHDAVRHDAALGAAHVEGAAKRRHRPGDGSRFVRRPRHPGPIGSAIAGVMQIKAGGIDRLAGIGDLAADHPPPRRAAARGKSRRSGRRFARC